MGVPLSWPVMEERLRVLASVADALFPPLKDKALESMRGGDDLSAQFYEFSGGGSDEMLLKASATAFFGHAFLRFTSQSHP